MIKLLIIDDLSPTDTTSTGGIELANPYAFLEEEHERRVAALKKYYRNLEIEEMKCGWFNPLKIQLYQRFLINKIKKTIRNNLPFKMRID